MKKKRIGWILLAICALALACVVGVVMGGTAVNSTKEMQEAGPASGQNTTDTPEPSMVPTRTLIPTLTSTPMSTRAPVATKAPVPTISASIKAQLQELVLVGAEMVAATGQGVTNYDFSYILRKVKAAYQLVSPVWPDELWAAKEYFAAAIEGWDLTLYLWNLKLGNKDNPTEPYINGYEILGDYAGGDLIYVTYPDTFIVLEYRGKQFLPFDENLSVLMTLAGTHYKVGQLLLLRDESW